MVKVFLPAGDSLALAESNCAVYGASGRETLSIAPGAVGLVIDQNVEEIRFPGLIGDYLYRQTGNQLQVYDRSGTTLVAKLAVYDGSILSFPDAGVNVRFAEDGTLYLTDWMVSATAPGPLLSSGHGYPISIVPFDTQRVYFGLDFSGSGPGFVSEGDYATFVLMLSQAQAVPLSINYVLTGFGGALVGTDTGEPAVSGEGVSVSGSTLTFAPGSTTATISVPIIADSLLEIGEGLSMSLANPSPGTKQPMVYSNSGIISLRDEVLSMPAFALTCNAADNAVQEGGLVVFTITPSSMLPESVNFKLALTGAVASGADTPASAADFYPSTANISFDMGDTAAKTLTVSVIADGVTEGSEGFQVVLLDNNNTPLATLTGVVNDAAEGVYLWQDTAQANEGGSLVYNVASIAAAPPGGISIPYTLSGSAVADLDYSGSAASGTLVIPAGATSARLTLHILPDDTTEGAETVAVALGTPTGAPLIAGRGALSSTINDTSQTPQTLIYLQPGESFVLNRSGLAVKGAAGTETAVLALATAGVAIDQNVEQVQFPFAASACRFQQAGGQLVVFDSSASVRLATITPQNDSDGTLLLFSDGSAEARWEHGALAVAGVEVGAVPVAIGIGGVGAGGALPAGMAADGWV